MPIPRALGRRSCGRTELVTVARTDQACPYCGATYDQAQPAGDAQVPIAGDWSVCWSCACISAFTGNGLEVRRLDQGEEWQAAVDPDIRAIIRLWESWLATWEQEQEPEQEEPTLPDCTFWNRIRRRP